jgi:predicted kinase
MKSFSQLVEELSPKNRKQVIGLPPVAIFITGGPGSGKDVTVRECIQAHSATELNFIQAMDCLNDKHTLSEKTDDYRMEGIRTRKNLIINGPADDIMRITTIKEELEDLGYKTKMIFVSTTNEASKKRNSTLRRMMNESMRQDKWEKSQHNRKVFSEMFEEFDIKDNSKDTSNIFTKLYETGPVVIKTPEPKIAKFNMDKDRASLIKRGNSSLTIPKDIKADGVSQSYDARRGGGSSSAGAGLGNQTYSESRGGTREFSNDDVSTFSAQVGGPKPNPLGEKKTLRKFREAIDSPSVEMGVGGVLGGASNKEPMVTPMDKYGQSGITIKKKKTGAK